MVNEIKIDIGNIFPEVMRHFTYQEIMNAEMTDRIVEFAQRWYHIKQKVKKEILSIEAGNKHIQDFTAQQS